MARPERRGSAGVGPARAQSSAARPGVLTHRTGAGRGCIPTAAHPQCGWGEPSTELGCRGACGSSSGEVPAHRALRVPALRGERSQGGRGSGRDPGSSAGPGWQLQFSTSSTRSGEGGEGRAAGQLLTLPQGSPSTAAAPSPLCRGPTTRPSLPPGSFPWQEKRPSAAPV